MLCQVYGALPNYCLLPLHYNLELETIQSKCEECKVNLRVQWTIVRYPEGILLGKPKLRHRIKQCPVCKKIYPFERLNNLVPPYGKYSLDIITKVGIARYVEHKQHIEIQKEIQDRYKILLPYGSISKILNRFLDYFAATHYASAKSMGDFLNKKYACTVFHLDGTCEAGTDVFFVIIDGNSKWALVSSRMSTENVPAITNIIETGVGLFGTPLATVHDLSNNINLAIKDVLLNNVDIVCQYHFLENVGERLCQKKHDTLTKLVQTLRIKSALTSIRSSLVKCSKKAEPISWELFNSYIDNPHQMLRLNTVQLRRYLIYGLLFWINDFRVELKGEYFPFDLPTLAFIRRCIKAYELLNILITSSSFKVEKIETMQRIANILRPFRNDETLVEAIKSLEKSESIFNEFRKVLRLNDCKNKPVLRQHQAPSTIEIAKKTEERLTKFKRRLTKIVETGTDKERISDARICITYLDKYWENLFGHATTPNGSNQPILISRTNNIPEQHFGKIKEGWRRRLGTKKLARHLQASRPEELLLLNLESKDYINVIYGGSLDNMPSRFAEQCSEIKNYTKNRKDTQINNHPIIINKRTIRSSDFLTKIEFGLETFIENYAIV